MAYDRYDRGDDRPRWRDESSSGRSERGWRGSEDSADATNAVSSSVREIKSHLGSATTMRSATILMTKGATSPPTVSAVTDVSRIEIEIATRTAACSPAAARANVTTIEAG